MTILKLKPAVKDYIWGGTRLRDEYNVQSDKDILAEAWVLSAHPDGPSIIVGGEHDGQPFNEYLNEVGMEVLGTNCRRFKEFPILTKLIDAKGDLSIQVHPANAYALENENQYGKTEMWYVLDAEPHAFLYFGFDHEISKEEFAERISNDTLPEVLHAVEVHKGDTFFIEAGTIHAIGKGLLIAEIQQNSNVTYRVYDYGRVGKDGKPRELHIDKAIAVTNRRPVNVYDTYPHLGDCDYFTVDKLTLDGFVARKANGTVTDASFLSVLILNGEGKITVNGETEKFTKGDSFFISAGSGAWEVEGTCDSILTTVRDKEDAVNVMLNAGSDFIDIAVTDTNNTELAKASYAVEENESLHGFIKDAVLSLLGENNLALDRCAALYIESTACDITDLKKSLSEILPFPVYTVK